MLSTYGGCLHHGTLVIVLLLRVQAKTARAADWFCSKCLSQPIPQFGFSDSATMLVREFRAQVNAPDVDTPIFVREPLVVWSMLSDVLTLFAVLPQANEFEQQIRTEIARRKNAAQRQVRTRCFCGCVQQYAIALLSHSRFLLPCQLKKARRPGQRKRKHPVAGAKPEDISADELEKYYWEVVDPDRIEAVNRMSYSILYGSDLDCRIVGSGFPQGDRQHRSPKGQSDIGFNEQPAGAPPTRSADDHKDFRAGVHGPSFSGDSHLKRPRDLQAAAGTDGQRSSDVDDYQKEVWQMYAKDGWNLNNMPLLSESVLQMLPGRIAGISRCVRLGAAQTLALNFVGKPVRRA